jgi:hypothetical protein
MFITTSATFLISTGELLQRNGYDYDGPVDLACGGGPSQSQQDIATQQQKFYSTMTSNYGQVFAGQQAILGSLQSAWKPILDAGPGQYGFTPAEDAAMRTQATTGVAQNYKFASQATGNAAATMGGGNSFLPSGANSQIQSQIASAAAGQQSAEQLGITEAGYGVGRQQFDKASAALGGVASMMDPTRYAGAASNAGADAYSSAKINQDMVNAASPWNAVSGILGGALGAGLGAFTGGIGGGLASSLMGGAAKGGIGSSMFSLAGGGLGGAPVTGSTNPDQIS